MLKGRLGLDKTKINHNERHPFFYIENGKLSVNDGTLQFTTSGYNELSPGVYNIPYQTISIIMAGPGTSITHDTFRLCASHGTGIVITGQNGVKFYASMPFGMDKSNMARAQIRLWSDLETRNQIAKIFYKHRFGGELPSNDIEQLRGMEGIRVKNSYKLYAEKYGFQWTTRKFNKKDHTKDDEMNQAINHASSFLRAAANIATAQTSMIPQIGFIHEHSSESFCLDIADIYREKYCLNIAFSALKEYKEGFHSLEKYVRLKAIKTFENEKVISQMIDFITKVFSK